jgi:hypothetical protein
MKKIIFFLLIYLLAGKMMAAGLVTETDINILKIYIPDKKEGNSKYLLKGSGSISISCGVT